MKKSTLLFACLLSASSWAQDPVEAIAVPTQKSTLEIYGFAMADAGYNFNQINPDWYDAMRPSKLPSFQDEFGTNGNTFLSVRQTRFGVKALIPSKIGEFKTVFDFDLFGVGPDAGVTTIRLRHAYGVLGHFSAGQIESAFMDIDVFPNTFEYWGPCGMLFFRNVQVRWTPILGPSDLAFALEMPSASAERGIYDDRIELTDIAPRFPFPDVSGHYRFARDWGYVQLGAIWRYIKWADAGFQQYDVSGDAVGWGVSLSSNLNLGKKNVLRLQGTYGQGVETYFNDAPVDVGLENNFGDSLKPVIGVALPDWGAVAFLDHKWSDKFTSSVGYSTTIIENSDAQDPSAYHMGQYAIANLIYYPIPEVLIGVEYQWIYRENFSDGFTSQANKINFSFKYNFSQIIK